MSRIRIPGKRHQSNAFARMKLGIKPPLAESLSRPVEPEIQRKTTTINTHSAAISIMRGDMKFNQETIFECDPRYAEVLEIFA